MMSHSGLMSSTTRHKGSNSIDSVELLQQAAEWFAVMGDETVSESEKNDWQQWLNHSDQNKQAWRKVEEIDRQFNGLPLVASRAALSTSKKSQISRRHALKVLGFSFVACGSLWQVARSQQWNAQYSTVRGEISQFTLEDGSQLWLNTNSAVDVVYSSTLRRIILHSGEIYIETAQDTLVNKRPLVVDTEMSRLKALGTRFNVREYENKTLLSVSEGAVEIGLKTSSDEHFNTQQIDAGQQAYFNENNIEAASELEPLSWTKGSILANNMRLDDFVDELNRYYNGHLSLDPVVADLRLVGAYPVNDIERIFSALEKTLPVTVSHTLPWWVRIQAVEG